MTRNWAKVLGSSGISLILCVSSFAQIKVAVVDSNAFYDEKSGIKKLINALKLTYDCDFYRSGIVKRIAELKVEIEESKRLNRLSENGDLELSRLEKELKERREIQEKRRSILLEPIQKKIKTKLELFQKEKAYKKILDLSDDKIINTVLYFNESIDITNEFIKFCNEEFEKEK